MPNVVQRATEIMMTWKEDPEVSEGCHMHTGCWFWAMALAYYERGNDSKAGHYAQMAQTAWLAPRRAYTQYGP